MKFLIPKAIAAALYEDIFYETTFIKLAVCFFESWLKLRHSRQTDSLSSRQRIHTLGRRALSRRRRRMK